MIRRRRPPREIPFSFDSFLDVVANVVGIILRLIIVAWVGARSYHGPLPPAPPSPPPLPEAVALPEPTDQLTHEVEKQQRQLALAQARLLEETRAIEGVQQRRERSAATEKELADQLHAKRASVAAVSVVDQTVEKPALPLSAIAERGQRVAAEIAALKQAPSAKQTLRYRTPVSQVLQSEELMFECKAGRVAVVDIGALLEEVRRGVRERRDTVERVWEFNEVTAPIGSFRLRYQVEHDTTNSALSLSQWEVDPISSERGEDADKALTSESAFRKVVDALDPQQTAVTFWVYPDSFAIYRKLRDFLHERDVVVAGRPLPDGVPIRSTKHGSASRGQ